MNYLNDNMCSLMPRKIAVKINAEIHKMSSGGIDEFGNHLYSGVCLGYSTRPSTVDAIQDFQVRDDDVFLTSFPRSGTHWAYEIIALLLNDGKDGYVPFDNCLENHVMTPDDNVDNVIPGYKAFAAQPEDRRRIINSHLPSVLLPSQIMNSKMIYISRNPKDVMTSLAKVLKSLMGRHHLISDLIWRNLAGQVGYGSWFDHVLGFWEQRDNENFLFLKYEDLHKDLLGNIKRIAKFIGTDLDDNILEYIAERVGFTQMKENLEEAKLAHIQLLDKGKVGNWKNSFSVSESEIYDRICAEKLKGTGLQFDYQL